VISNTYRIALFFILILCRAYPSDRSSVFIIFIATFGHYRIQILLTSHTIKNRERFVDVVSTKGGKSSGSTDEQKFVDVVSTKGGKSSGSTDEQKFVDVISTKGGKSSGSTDVQKFVDSDAELYKIE